MTVDLLLCKKLYVFDTVLKYLQYKLSYSLGSHYHHQSLLKKKTGSKSERGVENVFQHTKICHPG